MEIYKVVSAIAVNLCGNDSSPGEAPKGDEGHLQNEVRYNANILIIFETLAVGAKII